MTRIISTKGRNQAVQPSDSPMVRREAERMRGRILPMGARRGIFAKLKGMIL